MCRLFGGGVGTFDGEFPFILIIGRASNVPRRERSFVRIERQSIVQGWRLVERSAASTSAWRPVDAGRLAAAVVRGVRTTCVFEMKTKVRDPVDSKWAFGSKGPSGDRSCRFFAKRGGYDLCRSGPNERCKNFRLIHVASIAWVSARVRRASLQTPECELVGHFVADRISNRCCFIQWRWVIRLGENGRG
jgi:hypothetical protein